MQRFLLAIFPGDQSWLWRRTACMSSVIALLYCIVLATERGDAALVDKLVIGLLGVLAVYTGSAVTDAQLKRKADPSTPETKP